MKLFRQDELSELGGLKAIRGAVVLDRHRAGSLEQILTVHDAFGPAFAVDGIRFGLRCGRRGGLSGSHDYFGVI